MKQHQVIQVTTAKKLSSALVSKVTAQIEKKFGTAKIEFLVDAALIGGIKLTVDSIEYDGSVRSKLAHLKQQMLMTSLKA